MELINPGELNLLKSRITELEDFIENIPVPLYWLNRNGIIVWANQSMLDLLGYEKTELIGRHISKFHVSQQLSEDTLFRLINKEKVNQSAAQIQCKNGKIKDTLVSCDPYLENNELLYTRCVIHDVTYFIREDQRKNSLYEKLSARNNELVQLIKRQSHDQQLEQERQESIFRKMIVEVQDYAIILLDKEGNIISWNIGAERIKGYTENEIIGQNFRIFYLPQDRQAKLPEILIEEAINTGRASHQGLRVRKNGTTFWGYIVITALHDDDGNVVGFTKVTRDISDKQPRNEK